MKVFTDICNKNESRHEISAVGKLAHL